MRLVSSVAVYTHLLLLFFSGAAAEMTGGETRMDKSALGTRLR